jgi:hypothetical protein
MAQATAAATQASASARRATRWGTASLWAGAGALLAAPFFAAFRSGGYGVKTQLIVGGLMFGLLALAALTAPWPPLPRGAPLMSFAALVGLTVWTGLSAGWARVDEAAAHDVYRLAMYCAAFGLALAVMRVPGVRRVAPVVLLAGILTVSLYALAGRLLPDLVDQTNTAVRLNQPFTYWNALGLFTGFGLLTGVALAGDRTRALRWRALACAAAVPCGLASVLTLSRGASAAVLAGLAVCVVMRRGRATLAAAGCALGAVIALGVALSALPDVATLGDDPSAQASQGAVFTPIALIVSAAAGLLYARVARTGAARLYPRLGRSGRLGVAAGIVVAVLSVSMAIAGSGTESSDVPRTAERLTRRETDRGHYWRVALDAFERHPLNGIGSGSFAVEWRRERGDDQIARDAHSLYLETLAELGIVGALLLLAFLAPLGVATLRAARDAPQDATTALAAGALAAFVVHAGLDWDWEMPSVVLVPLILTAAACYRRGGAAEPSRPA